MNDDDDSFSISGFKKLRMYLIISSWSSVSVALISILFCLPLKKMLILHLSLRVFSRITWCSPKNLAYYNIFYAQLFVIFG